MLLPLCGSTREQMLVPLSLQSKSFGSGAALVREEFGPGSRRWSACLRAQQRRACWPTTAQRARLEPGSERVQMVSCALNRRSKRLATD